MFTYCAQGIYSVQRLNIVCSESCSALLALNHGFLFFCKQTFRFQLVLETHFAAAASQSLLCFHVLFALGAVKHLPTEDTLNVNVKPIPM